jgi:pyridoxal phosphate enzyme (YggS family)
MKNRVSGYNRRMENEQERNLAVRLDQVLERIALAAGRAGRNPADITLVAVTKTWPAEVVVAAYRAGIRQVGENRAEELARKKEQVIEMLPDAGDLIWHQIGTLQSRKTRLVAENADVFHALDRLKIARRLSQQVTDFGRSLPVLLEVNLSGETSKSGFLANKWEEDATQRESLRNVIETIAQLPGLDLQGVMTMAPWGVQEDLIRSVFRRTRLLAEWLQNEVPHVTLNQLSMGMTDDFEIAIEEGATYVRVGRAIFGSRHQT